MKTAISIPDDLFKRADKLARRARKSRSQLFAEAMREYLARHDPDSVAEALDRVAAEVQPEQGEFVRRAARRTLERTEW
jgi:metal-responsive CopG/Arc/MetJ family transcriptional regulator